MVISRRRFITAVVLALTPLGATASAQEYKAQQAGKVWRIGVLQPVPLTARAQPAGKVYRVGILASASAVADMSGPDPVSRSMRAMLQKLKELGTEPRSAEGRLDRLPALAAELVRLPVDVIVAAKPSTVRAAQEATRRFQSPSPVCPIRSARVWSSASPIPAAT